MPTLADAWREVPIRGGGRFVMADLRRRAARETVRATAPGDVRILVDPVNPPEVSVRLWGTYEPEVIEAARRLLPLGGTAVDIGANCGVLSCVFAAFAGADGRVVAVDPSPAACARVAEQASAAGLGDGVRVVAVAVGESAGRERFLAGSIGIGALPVADAQFTTGAAVEVELATFDDVLARGGVSRVDLLKIDTDGSEIEVLRSARRCLELDRPAVIFEHACDGQRRRGHRPEEIAALLSDIDYELWAPDLRPRARWLAGPPRVCGFEPMALDTLGTTLLTNRNLVAVPRGSGGEVLAS